MRIVTILAAAAAVGFAGQALAQDLPTEEARQAAFKNNDKDEDGKLSKEEYAGVLKELGQDEAMAEQIFPFRDANSDGFISAEEYATPLQ